MTESQNNKTLTPKLAWQVNEFCQAIGIGRSTFYKMVARGEIETVIFGGRRLVPEPVASRLLGSLH